MDIVKTMAETSTLSNISPIACRTSGGTLVVLKPFVLAPQIRCFGTCSLSLPDVYNGQKSLTVLSVSDPRLAIPR